MKKLFLGVVALAAGAVLAQELVDFSRAGHPGRRNGTRIGRLHSRRASLESAQSRGERPADRDRLRV